MTHCMDEGFMPHKHETWKWRYGELIEDTKMTYYLGHWIGNSPAMESHNVPAGTTVKIVMASRFGDVGITENLDAEQGYGARVSLEALTNLRDKL